MTMRAHVIENGVVVNTILVESLDFMPNLVDAENGGEIGDTYSNGVFTKPESSFNTSEAVAKIDAAVEAIYDRPMKLSKEYEAREAAALAYKNAGYTGTVPPRLSGFATPAGMTPTDAANLILSQAATMRGALDQLSDLRMRKYEVLRAASPSAALAAFSDIMGKVIAIGAAVA